MLTTHIFSRHLRRPERREPRSGEESERCAATGILTERTLHDKGNCRDANVWREGFPEADWRGVLAVILSAAKELCGSLARP